MSYQVLARKWRPSSFSQMVGQEHAVKAITAALESERLHHAYLFTGTRGVGKTTVARLIAKSLNCETGVTANPCGTCASCLEIAEGRSVDVLEVDAASRTKVEDTRELLDNVQYAPTRSRFKIYLIDEVHMLSNHSFNALLKTLEEPPSHVKFLLATTDPQKLPATVLSRCLQFNLKNMVPGQIITHLSHVLSEEAISFDDESLALLARGAEGSMRDALSLTDQAIAHGSGKLTAEEVRAMLGTVSRGRVLDLLTAIVANDAQRALSVVDEIAMHSPDYAATLDELGSVLHQIAVEQAIPESLDESSPEFSRLLNLAKTFTTDDVHVLWQMAVASKRDLVLASDPRSGLDMAVLRMIAFRPAVVISDVNAESLEVPPAKKSEPPVMPVATTTPSTSMIASPQNAFENSDCDDEEAEPIDSTVPNSAAESAELAGSHDRLSEEVTSASVALPCDEAGIESMSTEIDGNRDRGDPVAHGAETEAANKASPPLSDAGKIQREPYSVSEGANVPDEDLPTPGSWPEFFSGLELKGVIHTVASHFELVHTFDRTLCFGVAPENATLYNERHKRGLANAIETLLEDTIEVQVSIHPTSDNTPARHREILEQQRLEAAKAALDSDDRLTALLTDFEATVIPNTVKPPLTDL